MLWNFAVFALIHNTPAVGIIGTLKGMAERPDSAALLANLNIPLLILAGDQDQIILPKKARAMAAALSRVTFTTVENAGHMPMLEQPQDTTNAIRSFLSEVGA